MCPPRLRPRCPTSGPVDGVSRPVAPSQVRGEGGPNLRTGQKAGEKTGFRHMQVQGWGGSWGKDGAREEWVLKTGWDAGERKARRLLQAGRLVSSLGVKWELSGREE